MGDLVRTEMRLPRELVAKVDAIAGKRGMTRTAYVIEALAPYVVADEDDDRHGQLVQGPVEAAPAPPEPRSTPPPPSAPLRTQHGHRWGRTFPITCLDCGEKR